MCILASLRIIASQERVATNGQMVAPTKDKSKMDSAMGSGSIQSTRLLMKEIGLMAKKRAKAKLSSKVAVSLKATSKMI